MRRDEGSFSGAGGVEIYWQAWMPDAAPRAVVVLAHGVSEHSGRYAHVGAALAEAGYATYALDHRGHGRSGGDRVVIDRFENVVADLDRFVESVAGRNRGVPLFLLGHSMGGCISIGYTLRHQKKLYGLLLSAPLSNPDAANALQRFVASLISRVLPGLGIFPVDAEAVSRDPEVVKAYEEDPLVDRRNLPARTVAELTAETGTFAKRAAEITLPVLLMHGTDDALVPFDGSEQLFGNLGSADKTFERYDGLFHEILNEPEQAEVIADMVGWLDARTQ